MKLRKEYMNIFERIGLIYGFLDKWWNFLNILKINLIGLTLDVILMKVLYFETSAISASFLCEIFLAKFTSELALFR